MRKSISFACILTLLFLSGCGSSKKISKDTRGEFLVPGRTLFEKARSLISVDPKSALEYYSEAKVHFQNVIERIEEDPNAAAKVKEANSYIKKINFGIDFINAKEKYGKMDIEEICRKISENLSLVPRYRDEYNDILTTVRKFELCKYLETESLTLIKKVERDLSILEKCAKFDTLEKTSLRCYRNGMEYYTAGQNYYAQWRQAKNRFSGNKAIEEFIKAINEFRNVEGQHTPQEYDEAQVRIQDAQGKIQEIRNWTPINRRPIAKAGSSQRVRVNTRVTLNGRASFDRDGDNLTYRWTKIAGPPVTLSNPTEENPVFTPQVVGNYTFRLVVNDGELLSDPDDVTITIITTGRNLGVVSHNGIRGDLVVVTNLASDEWAGKARIIQENTMSRGDYRCYRLYVKRYSDLEVCITPGYDLEGGGLSFGGERIFEWDKTHYKRFIRLRIQQGTQIEVTIKRKQDSPDDFRFIFKLFPR